MASYGAADASVVDQTLKKFQILTKKPELFLSRRDDIGEEFVKLTKSLYDLSKTIEKSALLESSKSRFSSALLSLITDGFDDEQIWQQIELENTACQPQLVKRISRLATRAKQSETFVDADEEIEEDHVNDDEEIEEEDDDDDDGGEEEEEDDIDDIKVDSEGESEPGSDMEQLQFSGDDSSDKSGDEEFWKLDKSTSTKKRPRPFDDLEENDIETDHPVARKRPKNSVVDDKFFRLADLEAFLNMEDSKMMESQEKSTKNYETNTDDDEDDDNESIDYFQDMQSSGNESNDDDDQSMDEESEVKLGKTSTRYRYDDFFDAMPEDGDNRDYNESNDRFMDDEDRRKPLDLFDNMDDDDGEKLMDDESKSTIEKRQEKIKQKIQALEESNLAEKPWQLKGEATSYTRPENSLLQETAAFDHTQRLAPVITEETTMKLEDIIQRRIRDHAWDDVERKIKPKEEPFEYKKRIVLDQEKSKLSLAQVYELEYLKHQQKEKPEEELAEHKTIKAMMTSLFTKLDALSNFHFTPKPPAPEVKIVSNLPSVTVEEVAPVTATTSSLLAPGEIMDPKAARLDKGDREKTKTDRLRERRLKKQHQSNRRKMREEREKLGGQTNPKMNKDKMLKKLVNDVEKDEAKSNTKLSSSKTVFGRLNEMQATKTTKKPNKQKEKHNYKS